MTPVNRSSVVGATIRSLTLIGALGACSRATSAPADGTNQELVLAVGESARVASTTIQLITVEDSRCPSDLVCITGGDVAIVLAFTGYGDARTDTLRLNATPRTASYGGLVFQPTDVTPYPKSQLPSAPKSLTLRVSLAPTL
jgi:hypothetical protein